jgi:hypothetical protein
MAQTRSSRQCGRMPAIEGKPDARRTRSILPMLRASDLKRHQTIGLASRFSVTACAFVSRWGRRRPRRLRCPWYQASEAFDDRKLKREVQLTELRLDMLLRRRKDIHHSPLRSHVASSLHTLCRRCG